MIKQEGKNNTASGQKPHALCLCERCCHDSVFFCAQCHSQHQRARASKIQKPESMELWKNWWKTTSWSLRRATARGVRRRGVGSKHHPQQRQRSADEPLQPGQYQPRFSETIPDQGERSQTPRLLTSAITHTTAAVKLLFTLYVPNLHFKRRPCFGDLAALTRRNKTVTPSTMTPRKQRGKGSA